MGDEWANFAAHASNQVVLPFFPSLIHERQNASIPKDPEIPPDEIKLVQVMSRYLVIGNYY